VTEGADAGGAKDLMTRIFGWISWVSVVLVGAAWLTTGCDRQAAGARAPRNARAKATAAADERPGGAAQAVTPTASATAGDQVAETDEDANEVDHWKDVPFDVHNFDEVLDYVATYYIDSTADRKRAWTEAANFALMTLEPAVELLPLTFFEQRKGLADEEGRLDGTTEAFLCRGAPIPGVVLHHIPNDEYLKAHQTTKRHRRLTDDEVRELRDRIRTRNSAYNEAWKPLAFSRPQFDCVMAYTEQKVEEFKAEAARKAAEPKPVVQAAPVGAVAKADAQAQGKPADAAAGSGPAHKGGAKVSDDKAKAGKSGNAKDAQAKDNPAQTEPKAANRGEPDDRPRPPPDLNRVWESAASGYLYALDPHSSIIPKEAWKQSTDETQDASFEGIGAVLTQREEMTIVENPMEGLPAWRAGIRAGDIIHKVDGVDVSGWVLTKVVKLIRGPKATQVKLTISRESDPTPRDIAITREHIDVKNVVGHLLKDYPGIAHIKMTGFIPDSTKDLRQMLDKLAKEAPGGQLTGIILDLRNNSGGLLNKAIEVADMFMSSGRIVSVKSRHRREEVYDASRQSSDIKLPLVVLVNDGAASASEIVASAIQDNARGLVVGLRTFGKASVQTLFEPALHTEYYIKLTIARYYAPSGTTIQVVGVTPDVEVAPEADGKIPVGFREENLNNHLVPIEGAAKSPWTPAMPSLNRCVETSGLAVQIAKREPAPQVHPDFQLLRAADYVTCLGRLPQPPVR
jgi:C-terminal peptidase prc